MLKNYLKIALRHFWRNKVYASINLAGLATSLAICLLIILFVRYEWSYDRFHKNADRIYLVTSVLDTNLSRFAQSVVTSSILAPKLKETFPEIVHAVRILHKRNVVVKCGNRLFKEKQFYYADANIFEMFSFELVKGDAKTALTEPNSVVISQEMAEKYFSDEDPVGKMFTVVGRGDFKITGVLKRIPRNSHLVFDFLASFQTFGEIEHPFKLYGVYTYVLLPENHPPSEIETKMSEHRDVLAWYLEGLNFKLVPLTKIHLDPNLSASMHHPGDIRYLYVLITIATLILLIACMNYINFATARSTQRAREVGIRKVLGAAQSRVARQFLCEAILFTFLAFVLSLALVELLLPLFNRLVDEPLHIHFVHDMSFLLVLGAFTLVVGFIAGSYPALLLSKFKPAQSLKGLLPIGFHKKPAFAMQRILVVLQFVISTVLIVSTVIIVEQMAFVHNFPLGFEKENIIELPIRNTPILTNYESFKTEVLKNPNILKASAASGSPFDGVVIVPRKIDGREFEMNNIVVDDDYLETLGMKLKSGRNFSRLYSTDAKHAIILNETAVKVFDLQDPLGKEFDGMDAKRKIIGVVEDFHSESLHKTVPPTVMYIFPRYYRNILLRLRSAHIPETIAFLKKKWREFVPNRPFEYSFLNEKFDQLYRKEEKLATIFEYSSGIAIMIACLGLFALTAFAAERHTKEIGIRKVLGATVANVVALLSKDFVKLVLLANLLAWPVAWWTMNKWLQNFAYRIDIEWWVFVLAGGLALGIVLLTVSTQAVRAALANPVEALRYE